MDTSESRRSARLRLWSWTVFLCTALSSTDVSDALSLAPVYWNSSNSLFKASTSTAPIEVQLRDDIDLVCPYYPPPDSENASSFEYYIIYQVSERQFDDCSLDASGGQTYMLMNCSAPDVRRRYTIIFEPFQSIPNVPEYSAGRTYFFITTSTGTLEGLSNQVHGACTDFNMRLAISVCCSKTTTPPQSAPQPLPSPSASQPGGYTSPMNTPTSIGSNASGAGKSSPSIFVTAAATAGSSTSSPGARQQVSSKPAEPQTNYQRTNAACVATVRLTLWHAILASAAIYR